MGKLFILDIFAIRILHIIFKFFHIVNNILNFIWQMNSMFLNIWQHHA